MGAVIDFPEVGPPSRPNVVQLDAKARTMITGSHVAANKYVATLLDDRAMSLFSDALDIGKSAAIHPKDAADRLYRIMGELEDLAREYRALANPQPPKGGAA